MDQDGGSRLVLAVVGAARYGLEMDQVVEVGRPPAVTRLPGLPPFVAGVVNWRGAVLPALDARVLLGAPGGTAPGRLVVLAPDGVPLVLLVDALDGVLDAGELLALPPTCPPAVAALLRGTVLAADGQPVAVLDPPALAALRERLAS